MNGPAILVECLKKSYGSVEALKGIDFEVPAGTIFGLLGPNGAGKTTAVRILSTILKPSAGRAEVLGYDVVSHAREVRYMIGLAGQSAAVDPNLTGRENLRLIGKLAQLPRGAISGRTDELLERFELVEAGDRPIRTYSGGMRRRLDVAAALVAKPPVIFLDEPTTGLDIQSRTELWRVIEELVGDGATVLLTTQYLEEADQLADRIAVVDGGRVVANDTASALKARLGGSVVELSMDDEQQAGRAYDLLAHLVPEPPDLEGLTVRFSTNDPTHVLTHALRGLDSHGLSAAGISVHEPSLDDVFLSLTGGGTGGRRSQNGARSRVRSAGPAESTGGLPKPAYNGAEDSFQRVVGDLALRAGAGDVVENLAEVMLAAMRHTQSGRTVDQRARSLLAGYLVLEQRFGRIGNGFSADDAASVLLGAAVGGSFTEPQSAGGDVSSFAYEAVRMVMDGIATDEAGTL